jgi:hypothetical protein
MTFGVGWWPRICECPGLNLASFRPCICTYLFVAGGYLEGIRQQLDQIIGA